MPSTRELQRMARRVEKTAHGPLDNRLITLAIVRGMITRDIYAETVAALGYDPLAPRRRRPLTVPLS